MALGGVYLWSRHRFSWLYQEPGFRLIRSLTSGIYEPITNQGARVSWTCSLHKQLFALKLRACQSSAKRKENAGGTTRRLYREWGIWFKSMRDLRKESGFAATGESSSCWWSWDLDDTTAPQFRWRDHCRSNCGGVAARFMSACDTRIAVAATTAGSEAKASKPVSGPPRALWAIGTIPCLWQNAKSPFWEHSMPHRQQISNLTQGLTQHLTQSNLKPYYSSVVL